MFGVKARKILATLTPEHQVNLIARAMVYQTKNGGSYRKALDEFAELYNADLDQTLPLEGCCYMKFEALFPIENGKLSSSVNMTVLLEMIMSAFGLSRPELEEIYMKNNPTFITQEETQIEPASSPRSKNGNLYMLQMVDILIYLRRKLISPKVIALTVFRFIDYYNEHPYREWTPDELAALNSAKDSAPLLPCLNQSLFHPATQQMSEIGALATKVKSFGLPIDGVGHMTYLSLMFDDWEETPEYGALGVAHAMQADADASDVSGIDIIAAIQSYALGRENPELRLMHHSLVEGFAKAFANQGLQLPLVGLYEDYPNLGILKLKSIYNLQVLDNFMEVAFGIRSVLDAASVLSDLSKRVNRGWGSRAPNSGWLSPAPGRLHDEKRSGWGEQDAMGAYYRTMLNK